MGRRSVAAAMAALAVAGIVGASPAIAAPADSPPGPALTIEEHARAVRHFDPFAWDTATVTGVPAPAAGVIDGAIARVVRRDLAYARSNAGGRCFGVSPCAAYVATVAQVPCVTGWLCVLHEREARWPGANGSDRAATSLVLDAATGRRMTIGQEVPASARPAFLASLDRAIVRAQREAGVYDPDLPPDVAFSDAQDWAPTPSGIRVWFDQYVAGPGVMGIVSVTVPYPAGSAVRP